MHAFVVIPCLNEADHLAETCSSLGFGEGHAQACLVLIDNGSSDATSAVMAELQSAEAPGRILTVFEPIQGYVSARRAGMRTVLDRARQDGLAFEQVLILQADADTIYLPGYLDAMCKAHTRAAGELLEGHVVTARVFGQQFPAFDKLCREVDHLMEPWFAQDKDQVVVDDKVCGFTLADYLAWGEHQDECDQHGTLVLAETTRLFMRAKRTARAWHHRVDEAVALPSRRKLLKQGPAYFAASGFPRTPEWVDAWMRSAPPSAAFLNEPHMWPELDRAVRSRQRHQIALFNVLPALFAGGASCARVLECVPSLADHAEATPAELLSHLLFLADEEAGGVDALLTASAQSPDRSIWLYPGADPT